MAKSKIKFGIGIIIIAVFLTSGSNLTDTFICKNRAFATVGEEVYLKESDQEVSTHYIVFTGKTKNGNGTTTWSYEVSSGDTGEEDTRAISHFTIGLCSSDTHTVKATSEPSEATREKRPQGNDKIKWEYEFAEDKRDTISFSFTLDEDWEITHVPVYVKAGQRNYNENVQGPSCTSPAQPDMNLEIDGNINDLNIDQTFLEQNQARQDLGSVSITVTSPESYEVKGCYTVTPEPSPSFETSFIKIFKNNLETINLKRCPNKKTIPGFSETATDGENNDYNIEANLSKLGDRKASDDFTVSLKFELVSK